MSFLLEVVAKTEKLDPKRDKDFSKLQETFNEGGCAVFAEALKAEFDYELGACTAEDDGEFMLLHAFAVKNGKSIDFDGVHKEKFPDLVTDYLAHNGIHYDNMDKCIPCSPASWKKILKKAETTMNAGLMKVAKDWIKKYRSYYETT